MILPTAGCVQACAKLAAWSGDPAEEAAVVTESVRHVMISSVRDLRECQRPAIWPLPVRGLRTAGLPKPTIEPVNFRATSMQQKFPVKRSKIPCSGSQNSLFWFPKFPVLNRNLSAAPPNNREKSGALPKLAGIRASDSSAFWNNREFEWLAGREGVRVGPLLRRTERSRASPAKPAILGAERDYLIAGAPRIGGLSASISGTAPDS